MVAPERRKLGYCCLCIPLRLGVTVITITYFFAALWCFIVLNLGETRRIAYSYRTTFTSAFVVLCAGNIFFAFAGFVGVIDSNKKCLKYFTDYSYLLLLGHILVLIYDFTLLMPSNCIPQDRITPDVYNPSIDLIARKGRCAWARRCLVMGGLLTNGFRYYFYLTCVKYMDKLAKPIPFMISFGKQAPVDCDNVCIVDDEDDPLRLEYERIEAEEVRHLNVMREQREEAIGLLQSKAAAL